MQGWPRTPPRGNNSLHITSTRFDDPRCLELLSRADRVVVIHGETSEPPAAFIGGLDKELEVRISAALPSGIDRGIHTQCTGTDPFNLCNRGRLGRGVQIELSLGLRSSFFASLKREGRCFPTKRFAEFVEALRAGLA